VNKKNEFGQSILEVVFSIGVIALVVTSSVILIVNSVGLKNKNLTRKKASDLAVLIVEDLVSEERNNKDEFWDLNYNPNVEKEDIFDYSVVYNGVSDEECTVSTCINAVITVDWGDDESLEVTRFFSR